MTAPPNGEQLHILGPDGEPYRRNGADPETLRRNPPQLWLPAHVASASIFGGPSRTYWHDRFDEALRNSREDAHSFKRDSRIQAMLKSASVPSCISSGTSTFPTYTIPTRNSSATW